MRFANPYALKIKTPKETLIFAASQRQGNEPSQEDYFLNFNDECFVLADGVGSLPQGELAAKFACETAIWAFKHIRQHRYYWLDKKLFMKRIFRTTNMAIWQKRREPGFEDGIATNLMVMIVGAKQYWLGVAGNSCAWMFHSGAMKKLTTEVGSKPEFERNILGVRRLGLVPLYKTGTLAVGDVYIMASAGCGNYLTPADLQTTAVTVGQTMEDATRAVMTLLSASETNGSAENMTALIMKRVAAQK